MAASSVSCSLSWLSNPVNFLSLINAESLDFEQIYSCVTPEALNGVVRGIKQLNYWRQKLQHLVSPEIIILTCITSQGLLRPKMHLLKAHINDLIGTGQIASIYYPENTNFVGLVFNDAGAARLVRQGVADIDGAPVCFVHAKDANEHSIRILWAPINCPLETVNSALNNFCQKVDINYEKTVFQDGDVVPSNNISGTIVLKDNTSLSTLPHILKINWIRDRHLLIIVKGRPPLCLRCRLTGHIRRNCPDRRCNLCNSSHPNDDKCPEKMYASVALPSSLTKQDDNIVNEGVDYPDEHDGNLSPITLTDLKPSIPRVDSSGSHFKILPDVSSDGLTPDTNSFQPAKHSKRQQASEVEPVEKKLKADLTSPVITKVGVKTRAATKVSLDKTTSNPDSSLKNHDIDTPSKFKVPKDMDCDVNSVSAVEKGIRLDQGVSRTILYCHVCHTNRVVRLPIRTELTCDCETPLLVIKDNCLIRTEDCLKPPDRI